MKLELEDKIVRRFPNLYADYGDNSSFAVFGMECFDGWFDLIWQMSEELEKYPIKVSQLKNKFSTIRTYVEPIDEEYGWEDDDFEKTFEITQRYEKLSESVCEYCGDLATGFSTGYISPRCEEHLNTFKTIEEMREASKQLAERQRKKYGS